MKPPNRAAGEVHWAGLRSRERFEIPRERVDDLVASGGAVHFDSGTGRPAKEWVAIDPSRRTEWLGLAKDAKKFVASSR